MQSFKFTFDIELDTKINLEGGAYWLAHIKATKAKMALMYDKDDKEGCIQLVPYNENHESDKSVKFTVLNSETIGGGINGYKYTGPSEISVPLKIYLPDLCTEASKAIMKIDNIAPSEKEKPETYLNAAIGKIKLPFMDEIFHYAFDPDAELESFKSKENNFSDDLMTEEQWKKPLSEKYLAELTQLMQSPEFLNNTKVGRGSNSELSMAIYLHNNGLKSAEDKRREAQGKSDKNQEGRRPPFKLDFKLNNNNVVAINDRIDGKAKTNKPKIVYAYATIQLTHKDK